MRRRLECMRTSQPVATQYERGGGGGKSFLFLRRAEKSRRSTAFDFRAIRFLKNSVTRPHARARSLLRKQHNMAHTSYNKKSLRDDNCRYSTVVVHFTCNEKVPCSIHGDGFFCFASLPLLLALGFLLVQFRAFFDHQNLRCSL